MSLRMNPTPLGAITYDSGGGSSSSSIMTSDDVDAGLAHDEATLSDPQPAANAAVQNDAANIVAEVREEPQCEITVVESDRPHNTAAHRGVLQQQSADLQLQQDQAPPQDRLAAPITPQPAAGASFQVAGGAGRVPWQTRIQNHVRRLGGISHEPAEQPSERRSGTRQIRRPRRFLDCFVPYFCSRKSSH